MTTGADVAAAVDQFLSTQKVVLGVETPPAWAPGYTEHERVIHFPLEVNGEQTGAKLMVVGFPRARSLKFRLGILFPGAVCRLDYTDETHPNTMSCALDGVPAIVIGPHYHSWRTNRRFCRGGLLPPRLHNAEVYEQRAKTFDAVLRWFCADNNIVGLPGNHGIELPTSDTFL
jgi:hypothetical protein